MKTPSPNEEAPNAILADRSGPGETHNKGISMNRSTKKRLPQKVGHVYVIEVGDRVKIGKSQTPLSRIKSIGTSAGVEVTKIYITPLHEGHSNTEQILHKRFASSRSKGEWFVLPFSDAASVAQELVKAEVSVERIDELLAAEAEGGKQLVNFFESWWSAERGAR